MKTALLILFVSLGLTSSAQTGFASQLKAIIKDSANRFNNFKSGLKDIIGQDSVYLSNIELEGTNDNYILVTSLNIVYSGTIPGIKNEKQGRKIVDEWKERILSITGVRFKLSKMKTAEWQLRRYGWAFMHGNVSVEIDLYPKRIVDTFAAISITCTNWSLQ